MQSSERIENRTARENRRGYLPARNRADDQEWFCSVRDCIRQVRIW